MSETAPAPVLESDPEAVASSVLGLYSVAGALLVVGIFVLVGYSIRLGLLVGPGVESSFGLALALMFLMSALLLHLVDRAYREWPLGRRIQTGGPLPVTDSDLVTFLKVLVVVAAIGGVGYIFWGLVTG